MGANTAIVRIDFDGDLDFSSATEDISEYVEQIEIDRGIQDALQSGRCVLTLRNWDRRFTPANASGPYYSQLKIGRRVEVLFPVTAAEGAPDLGSNGDFEEAGTGGTDVFAGWTEDAGDGAVLDETVNVYSGSHACHLDRLDADMPAVYRDYAVTPGRTYQIDCALQGYGYFEVYDPDNATRNWLVAATISDDSGAYVEYSQSVRIPPAMSTMRVRFRGTDMYVDDVHVFENPVHAFFGFIERIVPEWAAEGEQDLSAQVTVTDVLHHYALRKANTPMLLDQRTDELVGKLLDTLSWEGLLRWGYSRWGIDAIWAGPNTLARDLDAGETVVDFIQYQDAVVLPSLRDLVQVEQGMLWVGRDGRVHFENRHHRVLDRTSRHTFEDGDFSEMSPVQDETDVINHWKVVAYPREIRTPGSVCWSAHADDSPIKIAKGESKDFYPSWRTPGDELRCEVTDVITPVASTDYTANTKSDGTGGDATGYLNVVETTERDRYFLHVTNAAPFDVWITKLEIRATPLVSLDSVTLEATDRESMSEYLEREQEINNRLIASPLEAQALADHRLRMTAEPANRIEKLALSSLLGSTIAGQQKLREISDRITLDSDEHNVSGEYFIDRIRLTWRAENEFIETEWVVSEAPPTAWIWGVSTWGGSDAWTY